MTVPVLNCDTASGLLTLNGVLMHRDAWCIPDLLPLYNTATLRGGDRVIPHAVPALGGRRRRTITQVSLTIIVSGWYDPTGTFWTATGMTRDELLQMNFDYLEANTGVASTAGDGTVVASWNRTGPLADRSADVHNLGYVWTREPHQIASGLLTLSLPAGRFA